MSKNKKEKAEVKNVDTNEVKEKVNNEEIKTEEKVNNLIDALNDLDDVQSVYHNLEM